MAVPASTGRPGHLGWTLQNLDADVLDDVWPASGPSSTPSWPVSDALQRPGHVVTQLGPAHPRGRNRLADRAAGPAFHDFDDFVEQATRLLSERGLTERLGDAAAQHAHRDHTYDLRVAAILEKLS